MGYSLIGLILVGAAVLVALLLLWFGFKIFLMPLRLIWKMGRDVGGHIGPVPLMLVLIWTIAFEPAPFIYLWDWFLRFGKALLSDTPRQFAQIIYEVESACVGARSNCGESLGIAADRLWTSAIGNPIRSFEVPQGIVPAALAFAIGVTVAVAARRDPSTGGGGTPRGSSRTVLALGASFLLALYLSIVAIIAIPIFGEKAGDITPHRTRLAAQLKEAVAAADAKYSFDELDAGRRSLPSVVEVDAAIKASANSAWSLQLSLWDESRNRLEIAAALQKEASDFAKTVESHFQANNEGRLGESATSRHATVLTNAFQIWIANYRDGLEECRTTLYEGLGTLRQVHAALLGIKVDPGSGPNATRYAFDALDSAFRNQNFRRCGGEIRPYVRDYLLDRTGAVETLGPFGRAAAWLLRTESQELALIVGLLGFGFFGALAASFIKEFAGTPGNELPAVGFILPALVRGVGAAILVFLVAKGGTAILTRGDAQPNAYAIFVACFVAAVFSEDVWSWARTRQKRQLDVEEPRESPKEEASPTGNPANAPPVAKPGS